MLVAILSHLTNMSMEIVPREEASDFLGSIPIHVGPHYIEGFEKLSPTVVRNGMKKMLIVFLFCFISDFCDRQPSRDSEKELSV